MGGGEKAVVNIYTTVNDLAAIPELKTKIFPSANEEWLDFIIHNRNNDIPHDFDIVKGAVANDTLYRTLALFESGILTKAETIPRLKTHKLFDQISFNTHRAINYLTFKSAYEVSLF